MLIRLKLTQLSPILFSSLLLGCASTPAQETHSQAASTTQTQAQSSVIAAKPLTGQTFFELLLAEIAINRGEFGSAASIYQLISEHETDPAVFERAIALNQSIGNFTAVSELAQQWVAIEPEAAGPWQALTIAAMNTGNEEESLAALQQWLAIDPEADVSITLPHSSQLTPERASQLDLAFTELLNRYPKSHSLHYSHARLSALLEDYQEAIIAINKAIKLSPELTYQLFRYQILVKNEQIELATTLIKSLSKQYPTDPQIAITFARHLYQFDRTNFKQLQTLHSHFSTEPIITRTFARVAFEQNKLDAAAAVFQHLLEQGFEDEGHYFLGMINVENRLFDAAQMHFSQVTSPPYMASALAEWSRITDISGKAELLLALEQARSTDTEQVKLYWKIQANLELRLGNAQRAIDVYNQALSSLPNNTEVLYEQALLYALVDNYDALETNLLKVLDLEPDNINAMNALGYTWADIGKNLTQASSYIDYALSVQPDNPAFMDSKGWLLYRQGEASKALPWLSKAYQQLVNDEVAAHLAEVLWVLNENDEAQKYYQKVVELNPESPFIEKLERLFNEQ